MRNPRDMRTIQIEVTNACVRSCSNCTRFCGHHKKPYFMDLETFKKAVDSLEGFDGIVGIMGGEPTLHVNFRQMAEYAGEKFGKIGKMNTDKLVIIDFPGYVACKQQASMAINKDGGAGLWTSMTKQYYKHYELIQETFSFQNLNDHSKISYHQPILVTRKEYGIDDEEWEKLRNDCWIQNYWSASVTPKGVFFCEVAGALDVLFNGPGGFPIEKGWWKRDVSEFESQFHWCELCGVALKTFDRFKRDANEGIDDVSPILYEKLKEIGSKKIDSGNVKLFTATKDDFEDDDKYGSSRYIEDYSDRFGDAMANLRPKRLNIINTSGVKQNFGQTIYNKIKSDENSDWILLSDGESAFISEEEIKELYLNPGACFVKDGQLLFNTNASSFKKAGYDEFYRCENKNDIKKLWTGRNIVYLNDDFKTARYSYDISRWQSMMESEMLNDYAFRSLLYSEIDKNGIKKGDSIVLLLPATFYFGRAVYLLLENMGYNTHVFIFEGNKFHYEDLILGNKLHTFNGNQTYNMEKLRKECDAIKKQECFKGCLMLVNLPYTELASKDGYDEVMKIGEYMAERFIGCVNIRRRFSNFR